METVAKHLVDNPWVKRVRIEGYTDNRGSDAFNLDLSRRCAVSVKKFLLEHGVEESRLISEGYGEACPTANNRTKAGRAKNRRMEFIILEPS